MFHAVLRTSALDTAFSHLRILRVQTMSLRVRMPI